MHSLGIETDDFLEEELKEIEEGIGGYPGWMGAEHVECILGPGTTACSLSWEWLTFRSKKQAAIELLTRPCALRDSLNTTSFKP